LRSGSSDQCVLDEHDRRPVTGDRSEELDPRVLEPVADGKRMEVARDVEAEAQAEDLVPRKSLEDDLRRVVVEDAEVLLQDLRQRPVRDAVPVGETAADSAERLGRALL
jgi:hypothetical protein